MFQMEEQNKRIIKTLKGIQEQRILNNGISHELSAMAKEIDRHFKKTLEKIEKARSEK
jgi:hypothetical protein